jgi:hypothetical protein
VAWSRDMEGVARFILPAIEQTRSDLIPRARLRNIPGLDDFLHGLPLTFRGSIDSRFPAHVASCLGGPEST